MTKKQALGLVGEMILAAAVDLGLPESEKHHPAAGSFANNYGLPACDYRGPANRIAEESGPAHWRDFAGWVSLDFRIPPRHRSRDLVVSVLVRAYRVGEPTRPPAPTRVYFESEHGSRLLGDFSAPVDGAWRLFEWDVPEGAKTREFSVRIDDRDNLLSGEHHYGKSLAFIRIHRKEP